MRPTASPVAGRLALSVALLLAACGRDAPSPTLAPSAPTARPTAAPATPTRLPSPTPVVTPSLADLVDADAMRRHLEALQRFADESAGTRSTGTAGFEASVAYVSEQLNSSGYVVQHQVFEADGIAASNVVAEWRGASDDVLMLGAHVDSAPVGPGINDDGSGVAALLVIAHRIRDLSPPNLTLRFGLWGAEEGGQFGSAAYVAGLSTEERGRIRAYLNFDVLASPNAVRFVYDEAGAAPGSDGLTGAFAVAFEQAGLAWAPVDLEGDSDHGPFAEAGIPTGGLFSGGIEPVTDAQAAVFGAVAGEPADPCSHVACDTIDNIDLATLEEMADAIATVLVSIAFGS